MITMMMMIMMELMSMEVRIQRMREKFSPFSSQRFDLSSATPKDQIILNILKEKKIWLSL